MKKHATVTAPITTASTTLVAAKPAASAQPLFARGRALGGIAIKSQIKAGRNAESEIKAGG